MNRETTTNQLPPIFETWIDVYQDIIKQEGKFDKLNYFTYSLADFKAACGTQIIYYYLEKDFLKCRVFDEMRSKYPAFLDPQGIEMTLRKEGFEIARMMYQVKAEKYDDLNDKISKFYTAGDPENEDDDEENEQEGDLGDIGEVAARHFGYL